MQNRRPQFANGLMFVNRSLINSCDEHCHLQVDILLHWRGIIARRCTDDDTFVAADAREFTFTSQVVMSTAWVAMFMFKSM